MKEPKSEALAPLLAAVVRKHYIRIEDPTKCDGAQMWNSQWWMPLSGCDTLSNMFDDLVHTVERSKAANDKAQTTKRI